MNQWQQRFYEGLQSYNKSSIELDRLETLFPPSCSYADMAATITSFVENGWLTPVKAAGVNGKNPPLAYKYRIVRDRLNGAFWERLRNFQLEAHPALSLFSYFNGTEKEWEKDRPFIEKINRYLWENGLPEGVVPVPERSYALVQDEKWMDEKGGRALLKKIGLYDSMLLEGHADPLMLAINPRQIPASIHRHLIVENKATYEALLPALQEVPFTSLIYGMGNKITGNIHQLQRQLPLEGEQRLYYFGDLDYEGISIWYRLRMRAPVKLASRFYERMLEKPYSRGKEKQQKGAKAWEAFLSEFSADDQKKIMGMFAAGGYSPQEALSAQELQEIWRDMTWI